MQEAPILRYRGYHGGNLTFNPDTGSYHGRVVGIKDTITFRAPHPDLLDHEFQRSVDCYLHYQGSWQGVEIPPPAEELAEEQAALREFFEKHPPRPPVLFKYALVQNRGRAPEPVILACRRIQGCVMRIPEAISILQRAVDGIPLMEDAEVLDHPSHHAITLTRYREGAPADHCLLLKYRTPPEK